MTRGQALQMTGWEARSHAVRILFPRRPSTLRTPSGLYSHAVRSRFGRRHSGCGTAWRSMDSGTRLKAVHAYFTRVESCGDSNCKFQMKFSGFVLGCGILSLARQRMEKTGRRMRGAGGREEGRGNRTWSGILRRFPPSSGLGVELRGFWLGSRDEVRVAGYPV